MHSFLSFLANAEFSVSDHLIMRGILKIPFIKAAVFLYIQVPLEK